MPFETPFPQNLFAGDITATVHEHGGTAPQSVIRTDQSWAVNVEWKNTGFVTGMIAGNYDLHLLLECIGPGPDLDLTDPFLGDHIIPLKPGATPVSYFKHVDVPGNVVPAGVYKLVVLLRYLEPSGTPGPMAAYVETSPLLQFYNP
jgi:hypothetical protein